MSSVTDQWPRRYRGRFRSDAGLAYRAAAILLYLALTRSVFRIIGVIAVVIGAVGVGIAIAAEVKFLDGWQVYALIPLAIVVGGAVATIFTNPLTRRLYSPGSVSRVVVEQSQLIIDLNGNVFHGPVSDVVRVRHFGRLAAIEYSNGRFNILPTRMLPHHTRERGSRGAGGDEAVPGR